MANEPTLAASTYDTSTRAWIRWMPPASRRRWSAEMLFMVSINLTPSAGLALVLRFSSADIGKPLAESRKIFRGKLFAVFRFSEFLQSSRGGLPDVLLLIARKRFEVRE